MANGTPTPTALGAVSTVDALADALRDQILEGTVPPGSVLREGDLCAAFQVSRHSVRTALRGLTHEKLLRHEPNRGVKVAEFSADDVADLYRLRTLLELESVRQVSGDEEALAPMRSVLDRMRQLGPDASWAEVRDCDLDFHEALVNGLHSPRASEAFTSLRRELRLCLLQMKDELSDPAEIVLQHQAILDELEVGNTAGALALLKVHLDDACRNIQTAGPFAEAGDVAGR